MSRGKDHARIDFIKFYRAFDGILDEVQKKRNRAAFNLIDVKKTGHLEIMFLMQILNNVHKDTLFAQEILTIVREYKSKNILLTAGFSRQITLNFQTFNDLVPNSCLIQEMQYVIFGKYVPEKNVHTVNRELKKKLSVLFGASETLNKEIFSKIHSREKIAFDSEHEDDASSPVKKKDD